MKPIPGNTVSQAGRTVPTHQNLTPNEKAIIDGIRVPILKNLVIAVWRMKLRLQFTGWLQYMMPALFALLFLLVAGVAGLLGGRPVAIALMIAAALSLIMFAFDLVTVKFRVQPREHLPERNDALGVFDLMRERRSCRSYQIRKLTTADRDELMRYVELHSAEPNFGESPVRFEYVSAPITVWPAVNATEFLVAIAPVEYDRLAVIDVGHSLQKIVMKATRMGLGTCWIGPGADQKSIIRHLGERFDPLKDHIICVCAVGYRSPFMPLFIRVFNSQMHRRLPLSSLFFANPELTEPLNLEESPYARLGRTYEICQWAPSSYNGQTTRCVAVAKETGNGDGTRLARFDFYATTESRYYAPVAVGIWCANWEMGCEALGISGHFAVLSDGRRDIHDDEDQHHLPRYDISWVVDDSL